MLQPLRLRVVDCLGRRYTGTVGAKQLLPTHPDVAFAPRCGSSEETPLHNPPRCCPRRVQVSPARGTSGSAPLRVLSRSVRKPLARSERRRRPRGSAPTRHRECPGGAILRGF